LINLYSYGLLDQHPFLFKALAHNISTLHLQQ
jgi:hypothetical protein